MNSPLFSVVLTTYKREHLLPRAIRSVLNQTFRDFELIVVDDGGDKVIVETVRSFEDKRIILISNERNIGVAASRNKGIKASRGEYISFLDDDDEYYPEFLTKTSSYFLSDKYGAGFIWTGIRRVKDNGHGSEELYTKVFPEEFNSIEKGLIAATTIGNGFGLTVRRECFKEVGYYDETVDGSEDTEFLFRLVRCRKFATIPEILVKIHKHSHGQLTDCAGDKNRLEHYLRILTSNIDLINLYPELFYAHYSRIVELCYSLKMKKSGRYYLFEIFRRTPCHLSIYTNFLSYEIFGRRALKCRDIFLKHFKLA